MPRVFIPPLMRDLTNNVEAVDVGGENVREVIESLDRKFPGIQQRLCDGDNLKPGLSVAIGTKVSSLSLLEKTPEGCEVHFLPAISGGC